MGFPCALLRVKEAACSREGVRVEHPLSARTRQNVVKNSDGCILLGCESHVVGDDEVGVMEPGTRKSSSNKIRPGHTSTVSSLAWLGQSSANADQRIRPDADSARDA